MKDMIKRVTATTTKRTSHLMGHYQCVMGLHLKDSELEEKENSRHKRHTQPVQRERKTTILPERTERDSLR